MSNARQHPSYGMVRLNRISGNQYLFGAKLDTGHAVRLEISPGEVETQNGEDKYDSHGQSIITIDMTELQWARLISSMGNFAGSPCTIARLNGKQISPDTSTRKNITDIAFDRIREEVKKGTVEVDKKLEELQNILSNAKLPKKTMAEIASNLDAIQRTLNEKLPFVAGVIQEDTHNAVTEAYNEIDAYAQRVRLSLDHEAERKIGGTLSNQIAQIAITNNQV